MSKEVIIAGAVALVLTLATAAAFMIPKKPAEPVHSESEDVATNTPPSPTDSDTHADTATAGGTASSSTAFTGVGTGSGGDSGSSSSPAITPGGLPPVPGPGIGPVAGTGTGMGPGGFNGTTGGGMGPAPAPHPFTAPEPMAHPQPEPEQPPADGGDGAPREHVVESGETLADISEKYYNTTRYWKKIVAANPGIDANDIKVGQKLVIPVISHAQPANHGEAGAAPVEGGYTVQAGDSYYRIAQKELGNASRWKEIEKLNPDIEPSELHVGQVIKLPSKQGGSDDTSPESGHGGSAGADGGDSHVHVVAQGETLGEISKQYYGTSSKWRDIVKANPGIDPESLKPGTRLTMPDAGGPAGGHAGGAPQGEEQGPGGIYVVQKGDTLKTIAAKHLGSSKAWKQIIDANPGVDPGHLRVGQKLKLPGKGGETEGAAAPAAFAPAPSVFAPTAPAPSAFTAGPGSTTSSSGTFTTPGGTTGAASPPPFAPAPAPSAAHSP